VGVHRLHMETHTLSASAFYIFTPCLIFTALLDIQLDLNLIEYKYGGLIVKDHDV
jgi:hypothetical protein